jgi:hypothetical protein
MVQQNRSIGSRFRRSIGCAFSRRDGSHLTNRGRLMPDTIETKSGKTFARVHIGFVNLNADRAKCAPVAARWVSVPQGEAVTQR